MSEQALNNGTEMSSLHRSRWLLLGVLAAFVGPLLLAYVLMMVLKWAPPTHTNNGRLIEPLVTVDGLEAIAEGGKVLPADYWEGHWTLVFYAGQSCDLECEAALFKARQTRLALGRDAPRIHRVYLEASPAAHPGERLIREHPGMTVARLGANPAGFAALPTQQLYLVDPMGNLVLGYDDSATAKGLMKDLKRLLKVSKVG